MKKTAKRLLSMALVLAMLFSLGALALADGEKTPAYKSYTSLGDSIAAGFGPENTTVLGFQRVEGAYPALVADAVGAKLDQDAYSGFGTTELRYMLNDEFHAQYKAAGTKNAILDMIITQNDMDNARADFKADVQNAELITLQIGASDVVLGAANRVMSASENSSPLMQSLAKAIVEKAVKDGNIGVAISSMLDLAKRFGKLDDAVSAMVSGMYEGYETFKANYDYIIKDIYALNPDVTLVIVGMYNPFEGAALPDEAFRPAMTAGEEILADMTALLQRYAAAYDCPYADITDTETYTLPAIEDNTETNNILTAAHPSPAGHRYIADQIVGSLTEFINRPVNPFTDVTSDKYYYAPVLWAVNHDPQITGGYSDNTFRPQNTCTRAQIVTFIWRANGCPEPTSTSCTFVDVAPGAYYYKAVLWAVEKGITGGYNATTFGSNDTVTRAQAMTFLWRASDKPAAPDGTVNTFADVSSASYYYNAVLWAVANGITGGYNAQTFGSNDGCTRGQIVTFLYRSMK